MERERRAAAGALAKIAVMAEFIPQCGLNRGQMQV